MTPAAGPAALADSRDVHPLTPGALVHLRLAPLAPALARLGTKLTRRQNTLTFTQLNSRIPGSANISVRAPDGPGTIPGGALSMQTPDFWSIPFVGGAPAAADA